MCVPLDPRHQEELAGDRAGKVDKCVGKGIADRTKPLSVERVAFAKQVHDIEHPPSVTIRIIEPGNRGHAAVIRLGVGQAMLARLFPSWVIRWL